MSPQTPKAFAPHLTARVLGLVEELRRRHVFKVAVGYLVAAWLLLQVAETTFQPLRLPEWWLTALTILVVWIAGMFRLDSPPEVASAFTVIVAFAAGYIKSE